MSKKKTRTNIDLSGPITMGKNLAVSANVHLGGASKAADAQSMVLKPNKDEAISTKDAGTYSKAVKGGSGVKDRLKKALARQNVKKYKKGKKIKTLASHVKDVV